MYTTMIDETRLHDEFNEVISHLKSRHYVSISEKLQELDKTEKEYNQCIESLVPRHEVRFVELIKNVENINIFDINKFLQVIFDYFWRLSNNEDVSIIEEVYLDENDPFHRCRLRLSYQEEQSIIDTLNVQRQRVKDLRNVIDENTSEIVKDLRSCNDKLKIVRTKHNDLKDELNKVIHDVEVFGIY